MIGFSVMFEKLPELDVFLNKLRVGTGISDLQYVGNKMRLKHDVLDTDFGIVFIPEENRVEFLYGEERPRYLLDASTFALIQLGGKIDFDLPDWAGRKFYEVKNEFEKGLLC